MLSTLNNPQTTESRFRVFGGYFSGKMDSCTWKHW